MHKNKFIDFIITQKCTYRCKYCSQSKGQVAICENASSETIQAFYRLLDKIDKDFEITITGGEAMLHPDFFGIIKEVKLRGFKINLITNLSFKIEQYQKVFDTNRFCYSLYSFETTRTSLNISQDILLLAYTRLRHMPRM